MWIATGFLVASILVFTGLDFVINNVLYSYGLKFDTAWFMLYSVGYLSLYQLILGLIYFYTRSWTIPLLGETFVLSGGVDLVYFGVWGRMQFPSGVWAWSGYAMFLGLHWTTTIQVVWAVSVMSATSIFVLLKRK
jgi:hypothetical protein